MVSDSELHYFLRRHRRYSRYEGRGADAVRRILDSYHEDLSRAGWSVISRHESYNAQIVCFDERLVDLNADVPPVDYPPNNGHLAHILD